jgi:hypothetical protein
MSEAKGRKQQIKLKGGEMEAKQNETWTPGDKLVTEAEAADFLSLTVKTLQNWRYSGKGPPYYKFQRNVRYSMADLREFVKAQRFSIYATN